MNAPVATDAMRMRTGQQHLLLVMVLYGLLLLLGQQRSCRLLLMLRLQMHTFMTRLQRRLLLMVRFNRQPLGAQYIFDEITAGCGTAANADAAGEAAACVQRHGGGGVMIIVSMHYAAAGAGAAAVWTGWAVCAAAAAADCYDAIIRMALATVCRVCCDNRRWC